MLGKKRQEIRKEMRKMDVERQFHQIRNQLYDNYSLQSGPQQEQLKTMQQEMRNYLSELCQLVERQQFSWSIHNLEYISKQFDTNRNMSRLIISNCDKFALLLRLAVNALKLKSNNQLVELQIQRSLEQEFLARLLDLLGKVTYIEVEKDSFEKFIDSFWNICRQGVIDLSLSENTQMLELTLNAIYKMLEPQKEFILKTLKQNSLGYWLTSIAKTKGEVFRKPAQTVLIRLIEMYLYQESILYRNSQVCQINGVHIVGIENNQKQILMAYCFSVLQSRQQELYLHCINSLLIILKKYEYLCETICIEQVKGTLFELIQSPHRSIRAKGMNLVNFIIYQGEMDALIEFLRDMDLPNILSKVLLSELKEIDEQSKSIILSASCIMCNLTLVKVKQLKKQLSVHPIWDIAYQNIYTGSPLLPLVSAFDYYFNMVGRQFNFRMLESYLAGVAQLDLRLVSQQIREQVCHTIRRIYADCRDFWPEHLEERLVDLLRNHKLIYIVDEMMSVEEDPL